MKTSESEYLNMKKQIIPAWIILVCALVIAVGSVTFLGPCTHEDGSVGACHWAGRALLGLGCLLAVLSVLALLVRPARTGIYLSILPACILGMLTPGTLISLCRMSTMHCRAVMLPSMLILLAVAGLASLAGMWGCLRNRKG